MTILDAYAMIALLAGGPAQDQVRGLLREGAVGMATANVFEVLDVTERVKGIPADLVWDLIEPLIAGPIETLPLTVDVARRAADLRAGHYDRTRRPLSLADCVLLGSAAPGDRIATADPHVLEVAGLEDMQPLELPGESG